MSVRTKLILILSVVLALAFVSTSVISYLVSRDQYRSSSLGEVLPLLTDNILSDVQRDLMMPIQISSMMALDTFLKDWALGGEQDLGQVVNYLRSIGEAYGFFTSFFVSETTGHYYYYDGILKTISVDDAHDVWYYRFKEKNVDIDLEVDTNEASGGMLTVFINRRFVDYDGNFLGVTGVGLNMNNISQLLSEYRTRFGRMVYMVNSAGVIQAHPDPSFLQSRSILDMEGIASVAEAILAQESGAATYEFDRNGRHVRAEARYFPEFAWYLIAEQEEGPSIGRIRSVMFTNLAVGLLATCLILAIVIPVVNHFQKRLEVLASVDDLTDVANRRRFLQTLETEVARAQRYGRPLSLLMIDADGFKSVNDNYGHSTGDRTLAMLAETIRRCLRDTDFLGRLGGEEFGVILPETELRDALPTAERIRAAVESQSLQTKRGPLHITVSVGAALSHGSPDVEDLLHRADAAMYHAKADGRNCVRADQKDAI